MKYYTVHINRDSDDFAKLVAPFIDREPREFPNGSSYVKEVIKRNEGYGYRIRVLDEAPVGPGVDYGKYFCTRDHVITRVAITFALPESPEELQRVREGCF